MKKLAIFLTATTIYIAFFLTAYAETQPSATAPATLAAKTAEVTNITLYEQPDAKSKVVGTIIFGEAIIPIFSKGEWIKVADPTNGNVGWVNKDSLKQAGWPYINTYTRQITMPNGKGFQLLQFSGNQVIDQKQFQELFDNWQEQQKNLQATFGQLLNQSIINFNTMIRFINDQQRELNQLNMMQPTIVTPKSSTPATNPAHQPNRSTHPPTTEKEK